ncbi:MAG: glycosyltransferase [Nitrospinota bacterium]|nr:glycosyltransferase [Nitrospinota bacterium]
MKTDKDIEISFFIPCLNEEDNIGKTIECVIEVMKNMNMKYEILIVDDNSSDDTVNKITEEMNKNKNVIINLVKNLVTRGLGRNYFLASHKALGKHYMLVNGDAAETNETIRDIVTQKGNADMIIPYFGKNDSRVLLRRFLSVSFTFLVNIISGNRIKYYNGPVLHKTVNVKTFRSETIGFAYQAELICYLLNEKTTYIEIQVENSDREKGVSKAFTIKNILSVGNAVFHILLRRIVYLFFKV